MGPFSTFFKKFRYKSSNFLVLLQNNHMTSCWICISMLVEPNKKGIGSYISLISYFCKIFQPYGFVPKYHELHFRIFPVDLASSIYMCELWPSVHNNSSYPWAEKILKFEKNLSIFSKSKHQWFSADRKPITGLLLVEGLFKVSFKKKRDKEELRQSICAYCGLLFTTTLHFLEQKK